ncbi:MAG TPA: hypothetical protein VJ793_24425, partial [Anaerolineae bacterium]|nr:hypothetical protein [Anaerolineae bacterium]
CASAKSRISKRKRLNSDSRLSKHLPKLNETQVSEQERLLRRSNRLAGWGIASHKEARNDVGLSSYRNIGVSHGRDSNTDL